MKLISMTDFVLEQDKLLGDYEDFRAVIVSYTQFLKQPLELWMFIPCKLADGVQVVLSKPVNYESFEVGMSGKDFGFCFSDCEEYQQAKEICLFDGCEITEDEGIKYLKLTDKNHISFYNFDDKFKDKTIEDYSFDYGLILTTTAIKQIGL